LINSLSEVFEKQSINVDSEYTNQKNFFNENGYCVIEKSSLPVTEFADIIDLLIEKEGWRGGWEGKEEYMKYQKNFQPGAYRLGNLFNKHELFFEIITNEQILNVLSSILGDDIKIGALDMREPKKGTGQQDLHMDWIPKRESDDTENIVIMIFLDDSDENNGHLRVVPKTHKMKGWIEENIDDKTKHKDEIFLDVKKSSVVFMDANLWHSGTTNKTGQRRRVLFMDVRRRDIPQLLNQRIYLDETVQKKLTDVQKYLLGLRDNDSVFDERVFTAGNVYRKEFKTDGFVKMDK
tara:strand:- start:74 stop:952 length:879 start_codon:yes stop_codon:yes gene_type:complete